MTTVGVTPAPFSSVPDKSPCCDTQEKKLFQNLLQPTQNGQLPEQEGVIEFSQIVTDIANTNKCQTIFSPAGYFMVITGISVNPFPAASADVSIWAYPSKFPIANAAPNDAAPLTNDPGSPIATNINQMVSTICIRSLLALVPHVKTGVVGSFNVTIRGYQLRDCPENWGIL